MVPKGWDVKELGDIATVSSGGTPDRGVHGYWDGGNIPWIRTTEVQNCFLSYEDTKEFITELGLKKSSAKVFPAGTILIAMIGQGKTRGQVALLGFDATTNQNCAAVILKNGHCHDFFFQYLLSKYEYIRGSSNSAGQSNLSGGIIKQLRVVVPPEVEQRKIAQVLSAWDKAITTTEQLLANSQQQKKALMQQLLTGKKRLLDKNGVRFSGEWKEQALSEIAEIIVSPVDKLSNPDEIPVELCNYTDVYYNNKITRKLSFMRATATQSEIDRFSLKVGDVVITKDSETPGDIAVPALVSEDLGGVVCGYHLAIIRPKQNKLHGAFLNQLLSMQKTRYYFFTLATGATRFGLPVGGIAKARITAPSIDEQRAISDVLSVSDDEISELQEQLEALKQEKKALMQQLLTGKRRVNLRVGE